MKSKILLHDIRFLCELVDDLTRVDCVTFYHKINTFQQELNMSKIDYDQVYINSLGRCSFKPTSSIWLLSDFASIVFDESLRRVYYFMNSLMNIKFNNIIDSDWLFLLNPKWSITLDLYNKICHGDL